MSKKQLGHGFCIIDNSFILHFDSEVYKKFYTIIDFASFEIIKSNGSTFHYFKDKKHVYLESYMNAFTILPGANPADFKITDFATGFSNSGNHDYIFDTLLPYSLKDYTILSEYYQSVGDKIYFNYYTEVPQADRKSFQVLKGDTVKNVAKDNNHVYFREKIVADADAVSFELLEECFTATYYRECDHTYYAKDKNYAFYIDTIAKDFKKIKTKTLDQLHFKVMNELGYAIDGKYQYLFGKRKPLSVEQ
jgi:hypothetical protein